jgi:hypothetical protein
MWDRDYMDLTAASQAVSFRGGNITLMGKEEVGIDGRHVASARPCRLDVRSKNAAGSDDLTP